MTQSNSSGKGDAVFGVLSTIIFFGALGWGIFRAYNWLDSVGWIEHYEDSTITAQANWFVGESKTCVSVPLNSEVASSISKKPGYSASEFDCDRGPKHQIKISFYGREEQPEYTAVYWKCTRGESSFTCYELYGMR